MNLTWHIVKKDLRALKWPLALWLLCIVAKLGVGVALLSGGGTWDAEWFNRLDALAKILGAFEWISFVLTAAIVQQDLLVGTTAFWMTRPISGGRLLRAKAITLGLVFGLAPVLVTLPWWLGCHYGINEIAWAAGETLVAHAIAVLIGVLWAVVTDGFARFLLWTLVTVFTAPTLTFIIGYAVSRRAPNLFQEVISTRFVLVVLIGVIGILSVVIHQYLTRRTSRSIAIIGGTVGLMALTGAFWPWGWNLQEHFYTYVLRRAVGDWPTTEPRDLKFVLASAEFTGAGRPERPGRARSFAVKYSVEGLPAGEVLLPVWSEHAWVWPDGSRASGRSWGRIDWPGFVDAAAATHGAELPAFPVTLSYNAIVPATAMERIRAAAPSYHLAARLRVMRVVANEPVASAPGGWVDQAGFTERLVALEKEGPRLLATWVAHRPSLWLANVGGGELAPPADFSQYYLLNRATNYADRGTSADAKSTKIATVMISWRQMAFAAVPLAERKGSMIAAINALEDAQLMKLTFTEQARFTHAFDLSREQVARANP